MWNACFTHRWSIRGSGALSNQVDPVTGLPRYLLLDRKNEPTGGGYFNERLFDYGTQNFEQESIDRYYTYGQRALYRKLAPHYRSNPEMTIAVEPNHENEIVSGRNSVGDYNPKSLEGFYKYLLSLYEDLDTINEKMGSSFDKNSSMLPVDCCGAIGIDMILKTAISESGSNTTGSKFTDEWVPVIREALPRGFPRTDQKPPNS